MIVAKAPLRVSFAGGGTDLPAYYLRDLGGGLVLSCAIQQYVTVQASYTDTPAVHTNPIVEACADQLGLASKVQVEIESDVPGGTGLGSSGALTVATLLALDTLRGSTVDLKTPAGKYALADNACRIEIGRLKMSCGKQDQFASAYGGLNLLHFHYRGVPDGVVGVEPLILKSGILEEFQRHFLLFRVGQQRRSETILERQAAITSQKMSVLRKMRDKAFEMADLLKRGQFRDFGAALEYQWLLKRSILPAITSLDVDDIYVKAISLGAWGGKLCGAGGCGYMLLMADPAIHDKLRAGLGAPELPFVIDRQGAMVVADTVTESQKLPIEQYAWERVS